MPRSLPLEVCFHTTPPFGSMSPLHKSPLESARVPCSARRARASTHARARAGTMANTRRRVVGWACVRAGRLAGRSGGGGGGRALACAGGRRRYGDETYAEAMRDAYELVDQRVSTRLGHRPPPSEYLVNKASGAARPAAARRCCCTHARRSERTHTRKLESRRGAISHRADPDRCVGSEISTRSVSDRSLSRSSCSRDGCWMWDQSDRSITLAGAA